MFLLLKFMSVIFFKSLKVNFLMTKNKERIRLNSFQLNWIIKIKMNEKTTYCKNELWT